MAGQGIQLADDQLARGSIARRLGFWVGTSGGLQKVKVTKESLLNKARELGIEDDALNGLGNLKIRDLD